MRTFHFLLSALLLTSCVVVNAPSTHEDHGDSMTMQDMVQMLEGKTGDEFDKAFIEGMIPHHQGAIDMARAAQKSAKHAEIKEMADDIIEAQQREIDMMKEWQREWGYVSE